MFAGWDYADDMCSRADMVAEGYRAGVPMGGDLPARPAGAKAPAFVIAALRDAGTPEQPGSKLQRMQVIKIWVTPDGTPHEKVFDVAGDAQTGTDLDTATCTPSDAGADSLCTVWRDPEFAPDARAAYYVRAVEVPTCRWSTRVCNALSPEEQTTLGCDTLEVPKTIQERAWSSPVWYTPG